MDEKLRAIINRHATGLNLDPRLVAAITMVESGGQCKSARYEPNYKWLVEPGIWAMKQGISTATETAFQSTSWGPMHIMGATARDEGFTGFLPDLCDPELGVRYGCLYFKRQMRRYGDRVAEAISAYNAGRELCDLDGCLDEPYVMAVLKAYGGV